MLDHLLRALQDSAFANWVQQSVYPFVITFHAIGLATLVGLLVIIDLRVLGFGKGLPLPALRRLMTVVWIGFWINAASGAMLFSIDAKKDFYSNLFRIKLSAIALGLILGSIIKSKVLSTPSAFASADASTSSQAKILAVLSLLCWSGAIVSGRLLAYFTYGDVGIE
jgi:energy-coupling factor transporter transmembrane protein EcfT